MYIIYTNLLATSCVSCSFAFACGRRAAKASQKMVAEQWFDCRLVFFWKLTSHLTSVGHAAGAPVTVRDKTSKSGNALPGDKKNTTRRHQPRRCASSGFHKHTHASPWRRRIRSSRGSLASLGVFCNLAKGAQNIAPTVLC